MKNDTDTAALARINAAILVARTLVRAEAGTDAPHCEKIERRAQYAHLLAARCKLAPLGARRAVLGVWVAGLQRQPTLREQLAREHQIESLLDPQDPSPASRVLSILACYDQAKSRAPEVAADPATAEQILRDEWIAFPGDKDILRHFLKLLRDDQFLHAEPIPTRARVLLVDPDEKIAPMLALHLKQHGFEAVVTAGADEARRWLADSIPDAILIKADLPVENGIELCREIKSEPLTATVPLIVLTGRRQNHSAARALQAGADDALPKSANPETLLIKLDRLTDAASHAPSASSDAKAALDSVSGPLTDMPFTDMIQILAAGGNQMCISLSRDQEEGRVFVANGEVVHAHTGRKTGADAFYDLMRWHDGRFAVARQETMPPKTIEESLMSLLMEGSRRLDESS